MTNFVKVFQTLSARCGRLQLVLIGLIALSLSSCKTPQLLHSSQNRQTDSVIIRQIVRDTTIIQKSDSSMIQALLECDSLGKVHLKELIGYRAGDKLRPPTLTIRDNVLTATAVVDSLQIRIEWLERELYTVKSATYVEYRDVPVNYTTWWQKLWIALGQILSATAVLIIIYKLIKHK